MTVTIVNAAPMTIMLGTNDKSIRQPVREPEVLPTHLPKVYIYAQRGPTDPQLVVGGSRSTMYGEISFDLRQPWATHQTVLANIVNAQGNACMIERVVPADAAPPATLRLYADVLPTTIPLYKRNIDGSFELDEDGEKVPEGTTTAGYKLKWVVAQIENDQTGEDTFGRAPIVPGDQTDQATQEQSKRYPIMDLRVASFGAYGNNIGFRMYAPTQKSQNPIDERIIADSKVYPYRFGVVERSNATNTPLTIETINAEQYVQGGFKKGVLDKNTDVNLYIGETFIDAYEDTTSPNLPPQFGPFGASAVYDENIEALVKLFYAAETDFIDQFSDFTGEGEDEAYRFNFVSGVSSFNVPYHSFEIITNTANAAVFTEKSVRYCLGGSDGTMNEELFAKLVADRVSEYANPNSRLQDTAFYPESIIYDTGFPLATKYALCSFIAYRKDTFVVLSTHDVLGRSLTASEESSLAIALRTRLQMYPESEYFGTPVMRGMIVGRSGKMLNSQYTKRLPLTMEIAQKSARYMGAGNGIWENANAFDRYPASLVELFSDVNVTFTPASVRNKDWDNGLVWVQHYSRRSLFFPALKTVYDNDTSVLNSYFTVMACVELQKVGERAWRSFTGSSDLTNGQLIERVNQFVVDNTVGRFDDRFVIVPDAYISKADEQRGYSWSLRIKIYAPNMKTVMSLFIEAYRISDLEETA